MSGILGKLSWQFAKPEGQIYDNVKAKVLEFYPAGYTQKFIAPSFSVPGAAEEINRQEFFRRLWSEAKDVGRELELFPFEEYEYRVNLIPEPANRYDPFAIKIEFSTPNDSYWNDYSIGYVPAKINQMILAEQERISDIQILSLTDCLNDKYFCAKLAIGYDGVELNSLPDKVLNRFRKLRL